MELYFAFLLINILGLISPGPDFAIVTHYALRGSRESALLATLGVGCALIVHVLYCVLGIAFVIQHTPVIYHTIHIVGALYLGYLGIRILTTKPAGPSEKPHHLSRKEAFRNGLLTNLLNPKATLFLLSLFSQFILPDTTLVQKIAYGVTIPVSALLWFAFLSCLLTHRAFLPYIQRVQKPFTLVMGGILLILAIGVLTKSFTEFFL